MNKLFWKGYFNWKLIGESRDAEGASVWKNFQLPQRFWKFTQNKKALFNFNKILAFIHKWMDYFMWLL